MWILSLGHALVGTSVRRFEKSPPRTRVDSSALALLGTNRDNAIPVIRPWSGSRSAPSTVATTCCKRSREAGMSQRFASRYAARPG